MVLLLSFFQFLINYTYKLYESQELLFINCLIITTLAHNTIERNDFMNKAPIMISTKDLDYISDMINWNLNACKLARHFSNEVTDESIKSLLLQVSNMHSLHYEKLLNILR